MWHGGSLRRPLSLFMWWAPCPLDGFSLLYASLGGGNVSTGAFHSFPVYGVVLLCDMIHDSWKVHFRDRVLLSCPCDLNLFKGSYIMVDVPFLLLRIFSQSHKYTHMGNPHKGPGTLPLHSPGGVLLSLGCTNILLRVKWGFMAIATPWRWNTQLKASKTPLVQGTVNVVLVSLSL